MNKGIAGPSEDQLPFFFLLNVFLSYCSTKCLANIFPDFLVPGSVLLGPKSHGIVPAASLAEGSARRMGSLQNLLCTHICAQGSLNLLSTGAWAPAAQQRQKGLEHGGSRGARRVCCRGKACGAEAAAGSAGFCT